MGLTYLVLYSLLHILCLLQPTATSANQSIPSRCQCPSLEKNICGNLKNIVNITIEQTPSCTNEELMVFLKNKIKKKTVCINPVSSQGQAIRRCWTRFTDLKKRRKCFFRNGCKENNKRKRQTKRQANG